MNKDPAVWALVVRFFRWFLIEHPRAAFAVIAGFIVALWSGLADGKGWFHSIFGGIICVIFALPLMWSIQSSGQHVNLILLVPVFISFVGADRLRTATLEAFTHAIEIFKERYSSGKSDDK